MKILVAGGTGLIGTKIVRELRDRGHDAVAAARSVGVNTYTGEGLADAMAGVDSIIDVSNSGYRDIRAAIDFFYASTLNLLSYGAAAGVRRYFALSVVGTQKLATTERSYFAAKLAQETLLRSSTTPFTIVHSTQFFEYLEDIAELAAFAPTSNLAHALIRPIAGDDVARAMSRFVEHPPRSTLVELAGPEILRVGNILRSELRLRGDPREARGEPLAHYLGMAIGERELLPSSAAVISPTRFSDWLVNAS